MPCACGYEPTLDEMVEVHPSPSVPACAGSRRTTPTRFRYLSISGRFSGAQASICQKQDLRKVPQNQHRGHRAPGSARRRSYHFSSRPNS